jgi:hypothetical protein
MIAEKAADMIKAAHSHAANAALRPESAFA